MKQDTFNYDALYQSEEKVYPLREYTKSSASYGFSTTHENGYNSWYFLEKDEVSSSFSKMTFSSTDSFFIGNKARISKKEVTSYENYSASFKYISYKEADSVLLYLNLKIADGSGSFLIYKNNFLLKSVDYKKGDNLYIEAITSVEEKDEIYFVLKSDSEKTIASLNPSVAFDRDDFFLYHLTPFNKYYGDVYPYFDEKSMTLYMMYLWTDNAKLNDYKYALDLSFDFLTYTNIPEENNFDIREYYKKNGNLSLCYDVSRFIDLSKYKMIRDNALIYDEENKRFLLIAGCYYQFDSIKQTSDLVIYTSEDELGLMWKKEGNPVSLSYDRNLPECPSIMKIGNRWYAFVSVAYNTAHQVGPLQYWIGDENKDIMDVDFLNKEFSFLDGEDLCAARVFNVLDKVYMFGWIPKTYDTMPWSPWGGYLNLPREVVTHKDGSLGGRMDPGFRKKINYGNILQIPSLQVNGEKALLNDLDRNFVSFNLDMKDSSEFSYVLKQGENIYKISIIKENGKAFMQISSPYDLKHKINSTLEIPNKNNYDIYMSIDGEIIEFFVDDEYSLTGHTSMKNEKYDSYFYSDKSPLVSNICIDKLIPYWNLL